MLVAALAAGLLLAQASALTQPAELAAQPPAAPEAKAAKPEKPKQICKTEQVMGSVLPRRVCRTPERMEAERRAVERVVSPVVNN